MDAYSPSARLIQKWNFFMYSIMKTGPVILHNVIYNEGNYLSVTALQSASCSDEFLSSYAVLQLLPELTQITDDDINTVFFIDNETPHYRNILQTPEYEPTVKVTSDPFADMDRFTLDGETLQNMDNERSMACYHVNMASFLKLGQWFEYLKKAGVYDNSRIIIVSDHGYNLANFESMLVSEDNDAEWLNALLMVKDFGETGPLRTRYDFMTTGDVPVITMDGLIDDPVNPFTGNPITSDVDKEEQMATTAHEAWTVVSYRDKTTYDLSDGSFWKVHGDVRDKTKWERVE